MITVIFAIGAIVVLVVLFAFLKAYGEAWSH
jgi:hypothetical protein